MIMTNPDRHNIEFLGLGEVLVDLISEDIVHSLSEAKMYQRFVGGQVTNTAVNLMRLGVNATVAACVGQDGFGRFILGELERAGMDTSFLQNTPDTSTSLSIIARQTRTPDFAIYRGADPFLNSVSELLELIDACTIVHTSAFALSRDPARTTILELLQRAHNLGKLVSLDPNYHPRIWPDIPDFTETLEQAYQYVHLTKPSLDDCTRLFGKDLDVTQHIRRFLDWGLETVILTMGASGVILATADGHQHHIHPSQISVADVTGAGDAFWAGYLAACLDGASKLEAARTGQALAEMKIGTLGPLTEFPDMNTLSQRSRSIRYSSSNAQSNQIEP
jgi:fructokinase